MLDSLLGRTMTVIIDRPLGSRHPRYPDMIYSVNYGFIPNMMAADGEEQDVYLLGVSHPVETYTGVIIAILKRADDMEDKLVMAPAGVAFLDTEILKLTHFQEQYFQTSVQR